MFKIIKLCKIYVPKRCFANKEQKLEMKYLNVAEKNDAAKTIAGQLSNGTSRRREGLSVYNKIYEFEATVLGRKSKMTMTSVSGHLLTFEFLGSYRNWNNVDPQSLFDAPVRKSCNENFTAIKRTLEREVRNCQGLIIWTDCDREGENIGFEIIDVCRAIKPNITVYRAIFSEITGASVKRALQNLSQPDKRQSDAVDVRSELDLRTGAAITRFQTMRLQRLFPEKISNKLISYGSCQIPTLGFVAERYKEIEAFVSEPFWKIKVTHVIDDLTVEFLWARNRLFDKQACEDYYLLVIANPTATVESVTVKPKSRWRPTPLDTVELEKLGSRKLKLPAKEVMTIAEKLYTKGIISYPRTETNMFSKDIDLQSLVEQQTANRVWGSFAQRVMEWGPNPRNGNKSDQAHPPIHPTKMVTDLGGNEGRVYELICRHFLACVSKDATGSETIVTITIEGEKFTATGLVIYERNYLDVYIYDKWNAKQIHHYEEGQRFEPTEITMPEGHTTAPPLLTEADLIALMEKHGIGTDATHAEHINTIKERGYIGVVDNGCLVPGVIGMGLYEGYDAMELALAKPMLRAEFEQDLKKICLGEKDPKMLLREQIIKYKEAYKQIMDRITAMDEKMAQRILETPVQSNNSSNRNDTNSQDRGGENQNRLQELFQCPKCSIAPLALKPKKNQTGFLIGCLNFPDCKNCIWWPDDCKEPKVLDETCSKCGSEIKLLKFKLTNPYHKTLFNTPSGWYKTCLRCDVQFRNTFNINLESVKRMGPIVGDAPIPINYGIAAPPSGTAGGSTSNRPKTTSKTKKSKDSDTTLDNKAKKTRKPSVKPTTSNSSQRKKTLTSNIRSFFTSAAQQTAEEIVANELQNVPLDDFFDSNDGFDELVSSFEGNAQSSAPPTTSHIHQEAVLSEELAAAFLDDDDDIFAEIQWSAGSRNAMEQTNPTISTRRQDEFQWGSGRRNATERNTSNNPTTSARRQERNDDDDFQWGSGSRNATEQNASNNPNTSGRRQEYDVDDHMFVEIQWGSGSRNATEQNNSNNPATSTRRQEHNDNDDFQRGSGSRNATEQNASNNPTTSTRRQEHDNDFQWASGSRNAIEPTTSTRRQEHLDESFGNWLRDDNNNSNDEFVWGSAAKNARLSAIAPNAKRPKIENSETNDKPSSVDVKCMGCHQAAKELSVKKDGPNKGRYYFVCAKSNPCKFFQWSDESEQQTKPSRTFASASTWDQNQAPSTSRGCDSIDNRIADKTKYINCNCNKPANNLTVRKEGPNKGRDFYACANRDKSCGFFQWADETDNNQKSNTNAQEKDSNFRASNSNWGSNSRISSSSNSTLQRGALNDFDMPDDEETVNCNCNKPANSLIVKKDGPNKGRGFYACSNRDKSCGFFQWTTPTENQDASQRSWGSASSAETKQRTSSTTLVAAPKGRKCGLCRQEGHTRQKCPRKGEFEY